MVDASETLLAITVFSHTLTLDTVIKAKFPFLVVPHLYTMNSANKDIKCTFISLSTNRKLMLKYKTEALIIPTELCALKKMIITQSKQSPLRDLHTTPETYKCPEMKTTFLGKCQQSVT